MIYNAGLNVSREQNSKGLMCRCVKERKDWHGQSMDSRCSGVSKLKAGEVDRENKG